MMGVSKRALASLQSPKYQAGPDDVPDWVEPLRKHLADNLQRCASAGVPIALGTDVNNPTVFPGYSVHEELALMVEAGLTPAQALRSATVVAASFLGKEHQIGKIAVGYDANLLLLTGNPLEDIFKTRSLQRVMLRGKTWDEVISTSRVSSK